MLNQHVPNTPQSVSEINPNKADRALVFSGIPSRFLRYRGMFSRAGYARQKNELFFKIIVVDHGRRKAIEKQGKEEFSSQFD